MLASQMLPSVLQSLPQVQWNVAADGQCASRHMVEGSQDGAELVSRIRRDAVVYEPPTTRRRT